MAIASSALADPPAMLIVDTESKAVRNCRTVQAMVDGFANQDIISIMALIADDAIYCDIHGKGMRGEEYHGKDAIRKVFTRQFALAGTHSYDSAKILAEDSFAFASWVMVVGNPADPRAARFEGIDEFGFNSAGQIILKKAWLKGQPRLKRTLLAHNPKAVFRYLATSLKLWVS